ncbi:uncharacterized protein [Chiloscyllium punctatum]|uniref:uncharacterized protein isoform X3 n=1 Tax=Chiloscyllium punctatum TaxID=137246 RepID=UPI003B63291C
MDHQLEVGSENRPEQRSQMLEGNEKNLKQQAKSDNQSETVVSERKPEQRSQEQNDDENNLQQKTKLDSQCDTVVLEHRLEQRSQGQEGDEDNLQQQAKLDNQSITDEEKQDAMDSAQLQREGPECTLRHLKSPICKQDEQLNEEEEENHVENRLRPEQSSEAQEGNEPNLQQQAKLDNQSHTDEENQGETCERILLSNVQFPVCGQDGQLHQDKAKIHVENVGSENRPEQRSQMLEGNEKNLKQQAKSDNQSETEHRPEQRSQGQGGDENNLQQKTKLDNRSVTDTMGSAQQKEGTECTLRYLQSPKWRQDEQLIEEEEENQVENIVSEHRPEQRSQEQNGDENNLQQKTKLDSQCDTVVLEHRLEQRSQGQEGDEDNLQQQAKLDNQSITDEEKQDAMDSAQLQREGPECTLRHLKSPICKQDEQLNEEEEENHVENRLRPEQSSEAQEGETCERILLSNVQFPVCGQDGQLHQDKAKIHVENGQWSICLAAVLLVPVACILLNFLNQQESEVVKNKLDIFLQNFDKVQKSFPNQDEQIWKKSRIMLQKHINMTVHSEPSILMFAAAWNANETMHCLTDRIAEAYASAFNSKFLKIEGSSKKFLNSDKVKLDLDNQLTSWFGAGSKSAVIHHFQDLPPPSTLLFYKYCDHENAAFKDVSLLITVLVDEEKLDPNLSFSLLEERVYDFLVTKFSISSQTGQYNNLDIDKFSGLWSRIAHAILPVLPEKDIEKNGCKHQ